MRHIEIDAPDLLVHVDRKKDLIIRGGINISAVEIESLLVGHPKVADVAAVGRRDARLGERTCVFVVPRDPADPPELSDLTEYLEGERVARFKLPESLELIGQLPRNPAGKVLKRELRSLINGDDGRIVVNVDDPRVRNGGLGDLVDVVGGGQAGSDVKELAHARGRQLLHRGGQETPQHGRDQRELGHRGPHVVPIPGTRRIERLEENAGAATLALTDADQRKIADVLAQQAIAGSRYAPEAMAVLNG